MHVLQWGSPIIRFGAMMDEMKLYDIVDMPYVPFWKQWWFMPFLIFLTLITVILIFLLVRSMVRSKTTPTKHAIKKLDKISVLELKSQEEQKQFYILLSSILKEFFAGQFSFETVGLTDMEFRKFLAGKGVGRAILKGMDELFQGVDYIKFAGEKAIQQRISDDYARTRKLIYAAERLTLSSAKDENA